MDATIRLDHGMTFIGQADSGHAVLMDSDPSVGGDDGGPRPMELVLLGLGGCTGMDVISILRKMRAEVSSFEIKLSTVRETEHPKVFTAVTITYIVKGRNIKEENLAKAIKLSAERYCPAQAMLAKAMTIEHNYEIINED